MVHNNFDTDRSRVANRWKAVLEKHRNESLLVVMRGFPDPDAMACAMAQTYISEQFEIKCTILYFDDVSHYENRAFVKKLGIEMVRFSPNLDLKQFQGLVVVDSQTHDLPEELKTIPVVGVIDHHRLQGDASAEFVDIREDAGSASAIYAEYLAAGMAPMDIDNPVCSKLASALLFGIRSDTDEYLLAREIDYWAAAFLAAYSDRDLLLSISMQDISARTMDIIQRAYANKIITGTFLLAGVGYVREEDRDSIGQAADYLLRREGIDTVLTYGIVNNQFVDGSLRTMSAVVDPDHFLKELLGTDSHGIAFGGGRADKGGFKIPLGPFAQCGDRDLLWNMTQRTIEDLFFQKIGFTRTEHKP